MSLKEPHLKMSKSHLDARSRIHINDRPDVINDKVKLAMTDSIEGVSYDPDNRPGVSNLLVMMANLGPKRRTPEQVAQTCSMMSLRELKAEAACTISEALGPIREKYDYYMHGNASSYLDDVAIEGAKKASDQARETIGAVRAAVGL